MIRVALRGLAGRKFRTVLTAIAIVLGVAMMSGAYVLTDTIDKAFNAIFVESYSGTDAVVTGKRRSAMEAGSVGARDAAGGRTAIVQEAQSAVGAAVGERGDGAGALGDDVRLRRDDARPLAGPLRHRPSSRSAPR